MLVANKASLLILFFARNFRLRNGFPASSQHSASSTTMSPSPPKLKTFNAILFDMDGTLLNTEPLGCKAIYLNLKDKMSEKARKAFEERGYRMEWELKQQTLGLPDTKWAPIVLDWATKHWGVQDPPSMPDFLRQHDNIMKDQIPDVQACKGAKELMKKLCQMQGNEKKDLQLAIATSSHQESVRQKRIKHEDTIFANLDALVAGDDPNVKNGKPAPDIYVEAARRIEVDPKQCIVFEDGMPGVRSGKAAGCFVIAVPDPRFEAEERKQFAQEADLVLDDLTQFDPNWLLL